TVGKRFLQNHSQVQNLISQIHLIGERVGRIDAKRLKPFKSGIVSGLGVDGVIASRFVVVTVFAVSGSGVFPSEVMLPVVAVTSCLSDGTGSPLTSILDTTSDDRNPDRLPRALVTSAAGMN